jgi:Asp-tRNA(Asn)/Glu-tRNA(Gln) amidotransferase A subunit family amidase
MDIDMVAKALHAASLVEMADAIASARITARSLAEAQLGRISATDATVEAWAHLEPDRVRRAADRCDAAPAAGRGPLHGIGIGVKDIIATAELPTQMGSVVYAGHRPQDDAECIARRKRAGGYVFGKTVTTELAYYHPGKTKNPWNAKHTPGGSSSGSAAAVAAGHVNGAIGTQTNGSVIRPAAYCGAVGFKPTGGTIPAAGVHVFSETLDQVGTFARSVADIARLTSATADPGRIAPIVASGTNAPRLAWLGDFPWTRVDVDTSTTLAAAAARLRERGAEVVQVTIPEKWRDANVILRTIMMYEAATHLAALQDRERARFSAKLNAAIDEGRATPRGDYATAMARRDAAIAAFTEWLTGFDAILTPSAPSAAPAGLESTGDPACCTLWSLLGFPALSLPIGLADNGLPLGLQIAAPANADDRLLSVAQWCEVQLPFKGLV